jgi:hypothetical protein
LAQQTVTLVSSDRKEGRNAKGAWFFYTFEDAGGNKWQTGFGDSLGQTLDKQLNRSVKLTYHEEQRGNFTNNVIDGAEFRSADDIPADSVYTPKAAASTKDEQIARAVAFKGAIDLAANGVLDPDPDGIVAVAQHFESYLLTGQPVTEPDDIRL